MECPGSTGEVGCNGGGVCLRMRIIKQSYSERIGSQKSVVLRAYQEVGM